MELGRRNSIHFVTSSLSKLWPPIVAGCSVLGAVGGVMYQSGSLSVRVAIVASVFGGVGVAIAATAVQQIRTPERLSQGLIGTPVLGVVLIGLVIVGGVGVRAVAVESDRRVSLPNSVSGDAVFRTDPQLNEFGLQAIVSVDGRRYLAVFPEYLHDDIAPMLLGETFTMIGSPRPLDTSGATSMLHWARAQHLAGRVNVMRAERNQQQPWFIRAVNTMHRHLSDGANIIQDHDQRSLYTGILLGDDRDQSEVLAFQFTSTGMTHLLAVSGQNIAIVLTLLSQITRRLPPKTALVAMLIAIMFFCVLTRAEPSVIRACLMAAFACVGAWLGRRSSAARLLGITIALMVMVDPLVVFALGFQLSVLATIGILWLGPKLQQRLKGPPWVRETIATTLAAQAATTPLVCLISGGIPAATVLANFFATPASGVVMGFGVTAGNIVPLLPDSAGRLVILPAHLAVWWISIVGGVGSRLPLMFLTPGQLVMLVATSMGLYVVWRNRFPAWVGMLGFVFIGIQLWSTPVAGSHQIGPGAALHVGSCLGTVVEMRETSRPDALLQAVWKQGVRRVDVLVVTPSTANTPAAAILVEQFQIPHRINIDSSETAKSVRSALTEPCGRSPSAATAD